jgi:predicted MFS family arabinose efflux permease
MTDSIRTLAPVDPPAAYRPATVATMAMFFMVGATYATWGIHIPTIRERFGLSEAWLSLAMFAVAGGAILASGRIGRWVSAVGSMRATTIAGLCFALTTAGILLMPSFWLLLLWLIAFGMANAAVDVSMNAQAATVESLRPTPIMSTLHGMFSLGGMAGAAGGGWVLAQGVTPLAHTLGMAAIVVVVTLLARPALLPDPPAADHPSAKRARPGRALMLLGALAFFGLLGEGAMYDWTTVYMRDVSEAPIALASAGYAVFSGGMATARFTGDFLRARLGDAALLTASAWLAFAGIVLALVWPAPLVTLAGFAMMGIGAANMVPIFFIAASRLDGVAPAEAIAAVARLAYVGLLIGPVLIGGVAHLSDLRWGMSLIAVTMGGIALFGARSLRGYLDKPRR